MKRRYFVPGFYIVMVFAMAVFPLSSVGVSGMDEIYMVSFRLDHLLHLIVFIPVYPLARWAIYAPSFTKSLLLLSSCLIIGFVAEFIQYFIPYRSFNLADIIANLGGVISGFLLFYLFKWLFPEKLLQTIEHKLF